MKKLSVRIVALMTLLIMAFSMTALAEEANGIVSVTEEGFLNIATNAEFPPYEYKEGDDFAGIDIEIAGAIAKQLGLELKVNDVEFGSIIGGVQTGKYDMGIAGMTVTEEAKTQSQSSSVSGRGGAITTETPSGIAPGPRYTLLHCSAVPRYTTSVRFGAPARASILSEVTETGSITRHTYSFPSKECPAISLTFSGMMTVSSVPLYFVSISNSLISNRSVVYSAG